MSGERTISRTLRSHTCLFVATAFVSLAPRPMPNHAAAAPRFIIIYGELLHRRVVLSDWHENLRLMGAIDVSTRSDSSSVGNRPYLNMALFWGPDWSNYPSTPEALARLRPEQANQHGRFYPVQGALSALVLIGPAWGRAYTTVGAISQSGLDLLSRYGVPVRSP